MYFAGSKNTKNIILIFRVYSLKNPQILSKDKISMRDVTVMCLRAFVGLLVSKGDRDFNVHSFTELGLTNKPCALHAQTTQKCRH